LQSSQRSCSRECRRNFRTILSIYLIPLWKGRSTDRRRQHHHRPRRRREIMKIAKTLFPKRSSASHQFHHIHLLLSFCDSNNNINHRPPKIFSARHILSLTHGSNDATSTTINRRRHISTAAETVTALFWRGAIQ
jgi:hypothetical protein